MNDADIDLINKTFYPGWLMVSQLRSGEEVRTAKRCTDGPAGG